MSKEKLKLFWEERKETVITVGATVLGLGLLIATGLAKGSRDKLKVPDDFDPGTIRGVWRNGPDGRLVVASDVPIKELGGFGSALIKHCIASEQSILGITAEIDHM